MKTSSISDRPAVAIRSTHGCWTCRIRKKKCDEVSPGCRRCASVNIECHYGPKPSWIENPLLGKEELQRIKVIVRESASRKRRIYREKVCSNSNLSLAPPKRSSPSPLPRDRYSPMVAADSYNSEVQTHLEASPRSVVEKRLKEVGRNSADLMMHYLDHVFYIQFRFFTPSISTGGRGWLLSLLNNTKPLYHAALSLSAFHQQSLLSMEERNQAQIDYLDELERHHNLTLEELQFFIRGHNLSINGTTELSGNVQILACMVQLISFELFNGGTGKWQVHLGAASKLILTLNEVVQYVQHEDRLAPLDSDNDALPNDPALSFFISAIIWFDILACISTRSRPHLADHHKQLLSSNGGDKIQLHKLMGCQNWVMVIIAEMAQLAAFQNENGKGNSDNQHMSISAKQIQSRLKDRHARVQKEIRELREEYSGCPPHHLTDVYWQYEILVVTHIFACAAVIYLQTIVTAHPIAFHIDEPLQDTITALRMMPDPRMIRGMIWPLCVAGCMASSFVDQDFFRKTIESGITDSRTFGNSGKALAILEKSWDLQKREGQLIDCSTSIEKLGVCVLLV